MPKELGTFVICKSCNNLTPAEATCRTCGVTEPRIGTGTLRLDIPLVVYYCEHCDLEIDIEAVSCPRCGDVLDKSEPVDMSNVNQRIGFIRPQHHRMSELTQLPSALPPGQFPISTGQFALLLSSEDVISLHLLQGYEDACSHIDASNLVQLKSKHSRRGVKELIDHAAHLRQVYDHLTSYEVQGPNSELRDYLLLLYAEMMSVGYCLTQALCAAKIVDFRVAQTNLQKHVDRAADILRLISRTINEFDPEYVDSTVQDRVSRLLDRADNYEIGSEPDFAAILIRANGAQEMIPRFLDKANGYLKTVVGTTYNSFDENTKTDALLLAAEICAQPNPGSIAFRAQGIYQILEIAWVHDSARLTKYLNRDLRQYDTALSELVGQIQMQRELEYRASNIPLEVYRTEKVKRYLHVSEMTLRRLTNMLFIALDIIREKSRSIEFIQDMSLTDRLDELKKIDDVALRRALIGAETHLRNAAAHGNVGTNSPNIEFASTREFSAYSDDQFDAIFASLLASCHSLRVARESFTLVHSPDVKRLFESSYGQLSFEFLKTWVGIFGLKRATVQCHGPDVHLKSEDHNENSSSWSWERLVTMTGLLGSTIPGTHYNTLTIQITNPHGDEPRAVIRVPLTLCKLVRSIGQTLQPVAISLLAENAEIAVFQDKVEQQLPRFQLVTFSVLEEVLSDAREVTSLEELAEQLGLLIQELDDSRSNASVRGLKDILRGLRQISRSNAMASVTSADENPLVKRGLEKLRRQAKDIAESSETHSED